MNEIKKKKQLKARKLCNIFKFFDYLTSVNDSNYNYISPDEIKLGKGNANKLEARFLD